MHCVIWLAIKLANVYRTLIVQHSNLESSGNYGKFKDKNYTPATEIGPSAPFLLSNSSHANKIPEDAIQWKIGSLGIIAS